MSLHNYCIPYASINILSWNTDVAVDFLVVDHDYACHVMSCDFSCTSRSGVIPTNYDPLQVILSAVGWANANTVYFCIWATYVYPVQYLFVCVGPFWETLYYTGWTLTLCVHTVLACELVYSQTSQCAYQSQPPFVNTSVNCIKVFIS